MTHIKFEQKSPRGTATLDTECVVVDTDGKAWICSGRPANHGLKSASDEEVAALAGHFGRTWDAAIKAMTALVD